MKTTTATTFAAILALAALAGCRREYWCETVIETPGLTENAKADVLAALGKYEGVDKSSVKFDFATKSVRLKYDSMKVAQTNLRMAIAAKGIEVKYPEKTSGAAGYINERPASVER